MSEPIKALNYLIDQMRRNVQDCQPISVAQAMFLIHEAVKLQYPLRKVDTPFPPKYLLSGQPWLEPDPSVGVVNYSAAQNTQPNGCTSATSVCAPAIFPQAERDDWFTQRIDPYDDRIRYLERFVHGLKAAGVGGK